MRVCVVSTQNNGKSSLSLLTACLFSATQRKTSVLMSTEKMTSDLTMTSSNRPKSVLNSVAVYGEALSSGTFRGDEIFDYGFRIGNAHTYLYDVYDSNIDRGSLDARLVEIFKKIPGDLVICEVSEESPEELKEQLFTTADAILYLFTADYNGIEQVRQFKTKHPPTITMKTGYVCSKYDRMALPEKEIATKVGTDTKSLIIYPYNSAVIQTAFRGKVESLIPKIIRGEPAVLNLRQRLLEVMQYLFDSGSWKYIKGVDKWDK